MATLTTNIESFTLDVNGTTLNKKEFTLKIEGVPDGSTVNSWTLNGIATASMNKGSASINIFGQTATEGTEFTIDLNKQISHGSVSGGISVRGNNKNASGTVTFSNLAHVVNYTEPVQTYTVKFVDWDGTVLKTESVTSGQSATAPSAPTRIGYSFIGWDKSFTNITSDLTVTAQYESVLMLKIKENNNWVNMAKIYKKVDGNWIEQTSDNWESLFDVNAVYNKIKTEYFAILYSDGAFIFQNDKTLDSSHGEVVEIYNMQNYNNYDANNPVPWRSNRPAITSIYLNDVDITDISNFFYGCTNLINFNANNFDTSNIVGMGNMFYNCSGLTSLDLSNFNTSNVTNMYAMFYNCSGLTSLDLSNFDASNVIGTKYMFYECSGLTSLDLSNFNTSNVTNMYAMFGYCSGLTSLDLSGFDTSNIVDMGCMFYDCSGLTSLDLGSFNTENVTTMQAMFYNCSGLTSLDLGSFNTENVANMRSMFNGCSGLTSLDLGNFNTDNVTTMYCMFQNCNALQSLDISNFNTSSVTDLSYMFATCDVLQTIDLSHFNTSNVTAMKNLFAGCDALASVNLNNFDFSKVTDASGMFLNCINPELKIYVSDNDAATFIKNTSNFPTTATVVIGSPN